MKNEVISPLIVSERIGKWLESIRSLNYDTAKEYKAELTDVFSKVEFDSRLISFYNLVDYKHSLAVEHEIFEDINEPTITDHALQFLYFDYLGQVAFSKKDYVKAIEYYAQAEKYISSDCELEQAEFYKRLGTSYYRIDQNAFALSFIKKANAIFSKKSEYKELELNCLVLLGGIYDDLSDYTRAQRTYQFALKQSDAYPLTKTLILRALGTSKFKEKDFESAYEHFKQSDKMPNSDPLIAAKTKIDLIHIMFILEKQNEFSYDHFDEANRFVIDKNDIEYKCRAAIVRAFYITGQEKDVARYLDELENNDLFVEATEISREISHFYRLKQDLGQALYFIDKANFYDLQTNLLLIDEEEIS